MDLTNRTPEELASMVLICPVHKLLCTACEHSTRIPRCWLSDELQRELDEIIAAMETNQHDEFRRSHPNPYSDELLAVRKKETKA